MPAPLKVLVVPSLLASRPSAYLTHLEAAGLEVLRSPLGRPYGEAELIEGLRGVFATVAGIEPYTERVLREAPDLEVIARFGVGYDQIDVPAATRHGVYVAMAFGANHETVADLALGLMARGRAEHCHLPPARDRGGLGVGVPAGPLASHGRDRGARAHRAGGGAALPRLRDAGAGP